MTFMLLETGLRSALRGKNCFDILVFSCTDQNFKMLSLAIRIFLQFDNNDNSYCNLNLQH
jgi:hypothetical protein